MKTIIFVSLWFFLFLPDAASSSGIVETQQNDDTTEIESSSKPDHAADLAGTMPESHEDEEIPAAFDEFPNLHPLFVHFPLILLLLSFFSQLFSFFIFREALSYVTMALLLGGFTGAYLASQVFHPHVGDLPARVAEIFETHETLANWTLWLSGITLLLKIISHFVFRMKALSEIIILLMIGTLGFLVSYTGHLGSQMVFIEGVGPQGKYLEGHENGGHGEDHQH